MPGALPCRHVAPSPSGMRAQRHDLLAACPAQVNAGELVVVVGEVGSGKSTLLQSILGESIKVPPPSHAPAQYNTAALCLGGSRVAKNREGFRATDSDVPCYYAHDIS